MAARTLKLNDTVLQGPGLILQGPGLILQGPGLILQGPGLILQGPALQGPGLILQGVEFNGPGVILQGPGLILQGPGLILQGTLFSGTLIKDDIEHNPSGLDFIGAEFDLRLTAIVDGVEIVEDIILRINDIQQSEAQADVYLYDLTYRAKSSETWLPYCGDREVAAVPLRHSWDLQTGDRVDNPNVVTFGCTNAVLAKCALWGYRPWATATSCEPKKASSDCKVVSLQDHHQACTRMARADYCGDGTPATVDGTLIDIWDLLSPQIQTPYTDWQLEARWTPKGASCLNYMRHPEFAYPACFAGKPAKCGKLDDKSLLFNAFAAE